MNIESVINVRNARKKRGGIKTKRKSSNLVLGSTSGVTSLVEAAAGNVLLRGWVVRREESKRQSASFHL